ncbi:MAG TPA: DUF5671 domain-containing protein [Candidatus Dormibacteraeota bacterium]|nr:DUF5671 domain-containing protein [Candidatus Dormibacteraeota bacterium]
MVLRRLYLYLVSAAALVVLSVGLALLGGTIMLFAFNDPSADSSRGQLAIFTAMTVVALPVWGVHFWFAQRFASRDPYERTSAIRRLYVYFACLVFSLATMIALAIMLGQLLRPLLDAGETLNAEQTAQVAWATVVFAAVWALHFLIARQDRTAVHEEGASATLRRWYMYIALIVGLLTLLASAQQLLELSWSALASKPAYPVLLSGQAGAALAGALLWGFHARTIALNHITDDRHSTLRALEGFIAVAISIATALFGGSQILYYALGRGLGVTNPGGASSDVLAAAAGPGSLLLVYGVAWFLIFRRLRRDAGTQEADRQAGVRRLYTNLAALISLAAWAYGAGLLLATLLEQVEAPVIGVKAPDWKDPVSLSVTLAVVGVTVWLAHWRHAPWAADRQSLSRRLYVWAALLGSVLAALGGGIGMLSSLLQQAFSANPKLNDVANLAFARYLAVVAVAAGVAIYHWRVLRADQAARPPKPAPAVAEPAAARPSPMHVGTNTQPATDALGPHTHRYTLVVSNATDDDVHQALANLPPQANYRLTPAEQSPTNSEPDGVSSRGPQEKAVDGH